MLLVGLTGGIGMGKTTVADLLAQRGELIIDTDVLARDLVEPGMPALEEIAATFGPEMIGTDGRLNRLALAQVVFDNATRRASLEAILHPRIRAAWRERAGRYADEGARRTVVVIPLLFETGAEQHLDLTICVACSGETQKQRLRQRGWKDEEIDRRLAAQHSIRQKMDKADRVIWNESLLEVCELQVDRIFELPRLQ